MVWARKKDQRSLGTWKKGSFFGSGGSDFLSGKIPGKGYLEKDRREKGTWKRNSG